nr:phosphoglucosamine mutase [Saprospiraceae bacterium]
VSSLAINTLLSMGIDVIDLGLSTTPTVEMMVTHLKCDAGIIFTASHNPKEWNALKFLDRKGEFISAETGKAILDIIDSGEITYADVDELGSATNYTDSIEDHIKEILALPYLDVDRIKSKTYHVVVDCINSSGAIAVPPLLDALGVTYTLINDVVDGNFAHNPEPLPAHLTELSETVIKEKADFGISIDPDVDRLAFVCEDGSVFGEEYTLVAVADAVLSRKIGPTVSNLSSTRALGDVTKSYGATYFASAVGEVNVVNMMKKTGAVIGGEGNGGVILPELHYGRDALAGIALFLDLLASKDKTVTELKKSYPSYSIIKDKIPADSLDIAASFQKLKTAFADEQLDSQDGLKIDFANGWVHMRTSNTEPIIRIYAEAPTETEAKELIDRVKDQI